MGGVARLPAAWRACAVAMCAVPVVAAVALAWLLLLCCAVAVVRFRRVKRRMQRRCRREEGGGGGAVDAGGDRVRLLHRYLEDQMELVLIGAGELFHDPTPREA